MLYKKLKTVWRNNNTDYIFLEKFKKEFPEISKVDAEELCERFCKLNMDFYFIEEKKVSNLVRITLPFAIIIILIMFIWLPIFFMITGKWGYSLGKKNRIFNWFKILGLI